MLAQDAIQSAISNYYSKNPHVKMTDLSGTEKKLSDAVAGSA
jgi:iron-sulfur cluster assembly enzyme ISCU, mitochondrial